MQKFYYPASCARSNAQDPAHTTGNHFPPWHEMVHFGPVLRFFRVKVRCTEHNPHAETQRTRRSEIKKQYSHIANKMVKKQTLMVGWPQ